MSSLSIVAPTRCDVRDQIAKYVAETLGQDEVSHIDPAARLLDSGADSLVLAEIVRFVEQRFCVKLALRQLFEELLTVDQIASFVLEARAPRESSPRNRAHAPLALQSEIAAHVAQLLEQRPEALDVRAPLLEAGADSLLLADLVGFMEKRWGISVALRQLFEELRSVHEIANYVAERLADKVDGVSIADTALSAHANNADKDVASTELIASLAVHVEKLLDMREGQLRADQVLLESGADSLVLADIVRFVEKSYGIHLPLRSLFEEARTVSAIARKIGQIQESAGCSERRVEIPSSSLSLGTGVEQQAQPESVADKSVVEKRPVRIKLPPHADHDDHCPEEPKPLSERQTATAERIVARLLECTRRSEAEAVRGRTVLCNNRRSLSHIHPLTEQVSYPIRARSSKGAYFTDIDGNDYVDTSMGFGINLFGHAPAFVTEAVSRQLALGIQLGPESEAAIDVAQGLASLTSHERFLFCNSGTEAVMTAIRLARAATGRSTIAVFRNAYHGHFDGTLVGARTVEDLAAVPMCIGVSEGMVSEIVVLPFNSDRALAYIRESGDRLAGVLVEPVQNRRPDLHPGDFLRRLRSLTREHELPLIFDEILIGFRVHPRGGQGWFGIEADLATYAKVIGGGMPLGVVAGRREIMDRVDGGASFGRPENGSVVDSTYTAGTYCKHPFAIAASRAVVDELLRAGPSLQENLNRRTDAFVQELNGRMACVGAPVAVHNFGSFFRFAENGNLSFVYQPLAMDLFNTSMISKGIYIVEGGTAFLSTVHTDADIERIVDAAESTVRELLDGGFWNEASALHSAPLTASLAAPAAQAHVGMKAEETHQVHACGEKTVANAAGLSPSANTCRDTGVTLSISFFGKSGDDDAWSYTDLIDIARKADTLGFEALWLPERHFHGFGGLSSNPSVIAAALSRETSRIRIRAGSVVAPLHHPVRIAEEWAMVDQLSNGRVGIAFASGWHAHDFIFAPEAFQDRKRLTQACVETVRKLWKGETARFDGGQGEQVDVRLHPQPIQKTLRTWIAALSNPETFEMAGCLGSGVLTNLIMQSPDELARNVGLYRTALASAGHDASSGHVVVLVHTFVGDTEEEAKSIASGPLDRYLRSSIDLESKTKRGSSAFRSGEHLSSEDQAYLLEQAAQRYLEHRSLIGSVQSCRRLVDKLSAAGVDEIACFVDFGLPVQLVSDCVERLSGLVASPSPTESVRFANLPVQRQILQASLMEERPSYQLRLTLEIDTPIDRDRLQVALSELVRRHAALRTTFSEDGETHFVHPPRDELVPLVVVDLTRIPATRKKEDLQTWFERDALTPIDLVAGPPFRFSLLWVTPARSLFVLVVHHIVYDNISEQVLLRELSQLLYASETVDDARKHLPPPVDYTDAVRALNSVIEEGTVRSMPYWAERLAGWKPLNLPFDREPVPPVETAGGRVRRLLSTSLRVRLQRLSAEWGGTPFMLLLAAYGRWLLEACGQDDALIGISVDIRPASVRDRLIINASNLMPIRVRHSSGLFKDEVTSVRKQVLDAMEHAMVASEALNEAFGRRSWSAPPLMQTCFNWDHLIAPSFGRMAAKVLGDPGFTTRFPLSLNVAEIDSDWWLEWDYASALFNHATVEAFADRFETLLASLHEAVGPALPLTTEVPAGATILARINEQCRAKPDEIALISETDSLSYRELKRRSDVLARQLVDAGIGCGDVVAVALAGIDAIIATIGIWKVGAAFAPLDPGAPAAWIDNACRRTSAKFILGGPPGCETPTIDAVASKGQGSLRPSVQSAPADAAYLITTSGTTGEPKTVLVEHRNLSAYVDAVNRRIAWNGGRFLLVTPIHVDLGYTMLWPGLALGGQVGIAAADAIQDAAVLGELVRRWDIAHLKITPTHLSALLAADPDGTFLPTQTLVCGGEPLMGHLVASVRELRSKLRIFNHYGPTETTVGAAMHEILPDVPLPDALPLGRALDHCSIRLLAPQGEDARPGEVGEIIVTGDAVARGYVSADGSVEYFAETARSERTYRTGDMARMNVDGLIEFVGRRDELSKIRGYRIDPNLVRRTLIEHACLTDAVIVPIDEGQALEAIVVTKPGAAVVERDLAAYLTEQLPAPMRPSRYRFVDVLPRTASGKADVRKLTVGDAPAPMDGAAHDPETSKMLGLYRELLKQPQLTHEQCFFEAGGYSLVALKLISRIKAEWGIKVGIRALFKHSTPAALAKFVSRQKVTA